MSVTSGTVTTAGTTATVLTGNVFLDGWRLNVDVFGILHVGGRPVADVAPEDAWPPPSNLRAAPTPPPSRPEFCETVPVLSERHAMHCWTLAGVEYTRTFTRVSDGVVVWSSPPFVARHSGVASLDIPRSSKPDAVRLDAGVEYVLTLTARLGDAVASNTKPVLLSE
jgi:hypothetical protein